MTPNPAQVISQYHHLSSRDDQQPFIRCELPSLNMGLFIQLLQLVSGLDSLREITLPLGSLEGLLKFVGADGESLLVAIPDPVASLKFGGG